MNHPWQQPIQPMEVRLPDSKIWVQVLFIRPKQIDGWEVITHTGIKWSYDELAGIRCPQADD